MTLSEDFFARGWKEGWKEGRKEIKAEAALNMYSLGAGKDFILKSTGLSEEELDKLIKENDGHSTGETTEPYIKLNRRDGAGCFI